MHPALSLWFLAAELLGELCELLFFSLQSFTSKLVQSAFARGVNSPRVGNGTFGSEENRTGR